MTRAATQAEINDRNRGYRDDYPRPADSQRLAVASLIGECEAIAASGELSESHEMSLRMLVANALTALGMPSKREREMV